MPKCEACEYDFLAKLKFVTSFLRHSCGPELSPAGTKEPRIDHEA